MNIHFSGQNMDYLKPRMAHLYLVLAIRDYNIVVKGYGERFRGLVNKDDVVQSEKKSMRRKKGGKFEMYNWTNRHKVYVQDFDDGMQMMIDWDSKKRNVFKYIHEGDDEITSGHHDRS